MKIFLVSLLIFFLTLWGYFYIRQCGGSNIEQMWWYIPYQITFLFVLLASGIISFISLMSSDDIQDF